MALSRRRVQRTVVPILFASLSGPLLVLASFTDVLGHLRCGLFVSNRPFTFWILRRLLFKVRFEGIRVSRKRQVLYWCTRFDSLSENIQRRTCKYEF
jgi:hypothetical protein